MRMGVLAEPCRRRPARGPHPRAGGVVLQQGPRRRRPGLGGGGGRGGGRSPRPRRARARRPRRSPAAGCPWPCSRPSRAPNGSSHEGSSERSIAGQERRDVVPRAEEVHRAGEPELGHEGSSQPAAGSRGCRDARPVPRRRSPRRAAGARPAPRAAGPASARMAMSWPFQGVIWATWPRSGAAGRNAPLGRAGGRGHARRVEACEVDGVVDALRRPGAARPASNRPGRRVRDGDDGARRCAGAPPGTAPPGRRSVGTCSWARTTTGGPPSRRRRAPP